MLVGEDDLKELLSDLVPGVVVPAATSDTANSTEGQVSKANNSPKGKIRGNARIRRSFERCSINESSC